MIPGSIEAPTNNVEHEFHVVDVIDRLFLSKGQHLTRNVGLSLGDCSNWAIRDWETYVSGENNRLWDMQWTATGIGGFPPNRLEVAADLLMEVQLAAGRKTCRIRRNPKPLKKQAPPTKRATIRQLIRLKLRGSDVMASHLGSAAYTP